MRHAYDHGYYMCWYGEVKQTPPLQNRILLVGKDILYRYGDS